MVPPGAVSAAVAGTRGGAIHREAIFMPSRRPVFFAAICDAQLCRVQHGLLALRTVIALVGCKRSSPVHVRESRPAAPIANACGLA